MRVYTPLMSLSYWDTTSLLFIAKRCVHIKHILIYQETRRWHSDNIATTPNLNKLFNADASNIRPEIITDWAWINAVNYI